MPATCDRHPTQPAWWKCPRCLKSLCPLCISRRSSGRFTEQTLYFCPKCNVEVPSLELSHVITPFWGRLHKFFVYPFCAWSSAGLILSISLVAAIFNQAGFIPGIIRFVLWALLVKYAFEALRATSSGRFRPPPLSQKVLSEDFGIVFKQIALYLALFFLFLFIAKTAPRAAVLGLGAGAMLLPAMLIILIINDNLAQALNPVLVIGLILRIGWSYLLLLLFLLLLTGAPAALGYAVIRHLPVWLRVFMITAANNYYTLIIYHMMGYVILQYHHRLDYPVELETVLASIYPAGTPASQNPGDTRPTAWQAGLLDEVSLLVQEGELEKAVELIESRRPTTEIDDPELSQRYITLLRMLKRHSGLLAYAPHHLELLARSGSKTRSVELYLECLQLDRNFSPPPVALFKIAGWLDQSGNNKAAVYALNCLIKNNPQDTMVPKALFRAAQIMHERLHDPDKAKKILDGLIRKFPDHELGVFARNYLGRM
jgi:tetratricopeptide (TPR) repeat protein